MPAEPRRVSPPATPARRSPRSSARRATTSSPTAATTFAQALSRLGLVDEYRLNIQPAALGAGMPLFDRLPAPLHLELVEAHAYPTGAAIHVYRPREPAAAETVEE